MTSCYAYERLRGQWSTVNAAVLVKRFVSGEHLSEVGYALHDEHVMCCYVCRRCCVAICSAGSWIRE